MKGLNKKVDRVNKNVEGFKKKMKGFDKKIIEQYDKNERICRIKKDLISE